MVISAGGKAVISPQGRKCRHDTIFPSEPEIDKADVVRRRIKSRATPSPSQRVRHIRLGNADNNAPAILRVPGYIAVWSAEGAKVFDRRAAAPESSVPALVSRQVGIACHPATVIDAVSPVYYSAERVEVDYVVCLRQGRSAAGRAKDDKKRLKRFPSS